MVKFCDYTLEPPYKKTTIVTYILIRPGNCLICSYVTNEISLPLSNLKYHRKYMLTTYMLHKYAFL